MKYSLNMNIKVNDTKNFNLERQDRTMVNILVDKEKENGVKQNGTMGIVSSVGER